MVSIKLLMCFILVICGNSSNLYAQKNNINGSNIYLADPTIFFNKGTYYLYGTVENASSKGFKGYTSKDLNHWKIADTSINNGYALKKGAAYGTANFWAPQIFKDELNFYMAYVANENIAIATSNDPLGPFIQNIPACLAAPEKQIDPFVFIDDDGKKYLYHVRLENGNKIFVAQMKNDLSNILPSTINLCITATEKWENTHASSWPVTEGPSILKHKNIYYLFYTANDFRNPDYAVGYATSLSPLGPWKKYSGNPIISRHILGVNGTGHGDFVRGENKKLFYVFHTHNADSAVSPRRTALIEVDFVKDLTTSGIDKLVIKQKSFHYLKTVN